MSFIYLDYNATTPLRPEVLRTVTALLESCYGNPSSPHEQGRLARAAVEEARGRAAAFLGCEPDEVLFTSGGSESNNHALKGVVHALRRKVKGKPRLITSRIEHPSVLEVCRWLEGEAYCVVDYLNVNSQGLVDPGEVEAAIRPETILISVMHANNEVGALQPIEEIARIAQRKGVLFHSDAAQSAGKIAVKVKSLGVDFLSLAGHKLYAPKGVGLLYARRGAPLNPLILGAGHESGRRAGTENVAGAAGLGLACELAGIELDENARRLRALRDRLEGAILREAPSARLNGPRDLRLPNTLSLSFQGVDAPRLLTELQGVAVSAGAACHAEGVRSSHVLEAMGVPPEAALGTLRFSLGLFTTEEEIDEAAKRVGRAIARVRRAGARGEC